MRVGLSELLQRCMDEVLRAVEGQDLKSIDQVIAYLTALDEALREAADALPVLRYALGTAWRARAEVAVSAAAYDTAAALFSEAAEGHAENDPRRGAYRMQAGETLIAKFDHSEDLKDVDDAVAVLRTAFTEVSRTAEAPGGIVEAAGRLGHTLAYRAHLASDLESLGESIRMLRTAVDHCTAEESERWRAVLANAMHLHGRLTTASADPPSPLVTENRRTLDVSDPHHRELLEQNRVLSHLASLVAAKRLSPGAAVERASDPAWSLDPSVVLSTAASAMNLASGGEAGQMIVLARLLLDTARRRWGTDPGSVWWAVGRLYRTVGLLTLDEFPNGRLYEELCTDADERTELLRGLQQDDGSDDEVAQRALAQALARALLDAADARTAPYLALVDTLAHPLVGAQELRSRAAEGEYRVNRRIEFHADQTQPDASTPMPDPLGPFKEAARLLKEAQSQATGHLRGCVLFSRARVEAVLDTPRPDGPDPRCLPWVREAYDLVKPADEPVRSIQLLHMLALFDEALVPETIEELLPVPIGSATSAEGRRRETEMVTAALNLALATGRRNLIRQLIDALPEESAGRPDADLRRLLMTAALHALPQDRMECPAGPFDVTESYRAMTARADEENWSDQRRSETVLHLIAHASRHSGGNRSALQALTEHANEGRRSSATRSVMAASTYLYGVLQEGAAEEYEEAGDTAEYIRHITAAAGFLFMVEEKDRSLLALFKAVDVLNSTTEPQEVARHALPVIDAATDLTFSLDESFDYHVYRLHQRLGRLIHGKDWSSGPLSLRHHQVAKGAAFSDAQARSGPLRTDIAGNHMFDTMLEPLRATSHEAGSAEEPSELPNLSDLLTAEQTLLSYVSSGENEPVTDADSDFRNELRSADLLINQTVFFPRRSRPRFTGEPRFPETEQIRSRLPPETVLISLFLCDVYATPGQEPELGLHMTSLTREGFTRSRRTSYGPRTPGGLLRIGDGRPTVWLHPVASTIAELRTRVVEEPLRRVVGREAEAMLDVALGHCLGTIEEELAEWRELGKTHLCIWPHGPLHYAPFHLLHSEGRPLADEWTISILPGLSALAPQDGDSPAPVNSGLLAIGSAAGGTLHGLPQVDLLTSHALAIATAAGGSLLNGPDATPLNFAASAAGKRYLHIAAHGAHNETAPWFQCLYLSPSAGHDGRLFAHDVLRLDLRGVELVTLGSCESGLGRFDLNDNLRGLPAAFLLAGAQAVVGCLWPVHPDVATLFFSELYGRIRAGAGRLSAFRDAQLATRVRFPAYRDWGSFSYTGDWR
ncbi:CHAT domain-containing protein [Streptomyces sp. NPDC051080]|uniref:CHAT domain-containing protein n=1 Tax=Streptomyces sp. NPDC051080 TaxID=3157222 RepID=UPI0034320391